MTRYEIGPDDGPDAARGAGFERWLADAAPTLNEPPATPKAEMWGEISRRLPGDSRRPVRTSWTSRKWTWPIMLAAALVLGAAIDRFMLRAPEAVDAPRIADVERAVKQPTSEVLGAQTGRTGGSAIDPVKPRPRPTGPERRATEERGPSTAMRLAATQTLAQAEMLLAAYRTDDMADADDARQLGRWARDVLSSTRLLLDTRVAEDAMLRELLQDLELVLMQIAQLAGDGARGRSDSVERELLDRTLRDRDLLPRIRSAVPSGSGSYTTTGTSD